VTARTTRILMAAGTTYGWRDPATGLIAPRSRSDGPFTVPADDAARLIGLGAAEAATRSAEQAPATQVPARAEAADDSDSTCVGPIGLGVAEPAPTPPRRGRPRGPSVKR
jgi:hypothetical protein